MTVSDQPSFIGPYQGNGSQTDYVYNKRFDNATDIIVLQRLRSAPFTVTQLTLNVDYSIIGSGPPYLSGATFRMAVAPANTLDTYIARQSDLSQDIPIGDQVDLPSSSIEQGLDKDMLIIQEINDLVNRAITRSPFTPGSFNLQLPEAVGTTGTNGLALCINDTGNGFKLSSTDIDAVVELATGSASDAAASAASAANSATAAASSANNASIQADSAYNSGVAAGAFATASSTSANAAATSASAAAASSVSASGYSGSSAASATASSTSAAAAATSASNASTSAGTATTQASNASTSASNAATSATNAATSATNSANSATAAAASAASINLRTINAQSANYTIVATDRLKCVQSTNTAPATFAITASATLGTGFEVEIKNSGTSNLTVDPAGAELIDSTSTITLTPGQSVVLVCNGTQWYSTSAYGFGASGATAALPTRYRGTLPPVYVSATSFSVAAIKDRDVTDASDIVKTGSTTVSTASTGLNGIAQSANLTGTVTVTAASTTVAFSTSQTGVLQAGDVITTSGGQSRRLASGSGTAWVAESNFTSSESAVTWKRGGKAPNTFYYLYAISDGTIPGLILTTRNVAGGDSLIDLPSGYTISRQQAFAIRLDSSGNIIPFVIGAGWPNRPVVRYTSQMSGYYGSASVTAGVTQCLSAGTATTYTAVSLVNYLPAISTLVALNTITVGNWVGLRPTGGASTVGFGNQSGPTVAEIVNVPTSTSQSIDYQNHAAGGSTTMDVLSYTVNVQV